ncbi:MAG: energy-coupling factor transporter transmembrane protein EcfT [Clostridiales bacterium]|nr:energy-coupling factor transporter transmembrane protein EcfT [Clostridiales bacterium]
MRDITFGQYYPKDSFVHRLDPRTKLIISIIYIVAIFLCKSYLAFLVCFLFLSTCILASQIPVFSILKTVKTVLFILIITVIINLFFYTDGKVLVSFWKIKITVDGAIFASFMAMRLIFLVVGTSLISLTTTPMNLTDGMESLMKPLKAIRFPVHDVAIIMSIALRFIPTLMEEINKIIMAQKARGASFDNGSLLKRAKALLPVLIPLFVSTFRIADELALALDARCYNATPNRTKMKQLHFKWQDLFAFLFTLAFLAVIILIKIGVVAW